MRDNRGQLTIRGARLMKRIADDQTPTKRRHAKAVQGRRERALHAREQSVARRESQIRAREKRTGDHDVEVTKREEALDLGERALRARAEADTARTARERLMVQLREANEKLVIATLRADELAKQAIAAHEIAAESATIEAERRKRAEALSTQLLASENALRASERQARASDRAKDNFLAMLGHELRNPLAPILLALDLIEMDSSDPHKREHTIIDRQVKQLVQLVDDLLDVSRIHSGKIELRRQPIEVADIVSRAVEMASPLIEAKGHTVTVEVPQHGLELDGDVLRLTQVVGNLLTNAAKYTPGGGSIVVSGERRGPKVLLRIRDNGIGISETMLPRIFDLFAQEQQSSGRAPGGLGLGLSIVRSLVALHGGTVTAHSAGLGRGSEFVIELPALARPNDAVSARPALDGAKPVTAHKILIVDDSHVVADLVGLALRKLGHDVRVAFDGPSALSSVEGFMPDVVLLDTGLPGMDGYQVATRLRTALAPHEAHFIAISGYGQEADRKRSADAGFDEHLVKPIDFATLQHAIEQAMGPGRLAQ